MKASRGYPDFPERIPSGWRVVPGEAWPINTTVGHDEELGIHAWKLETYDQVEVKLSLSYDQVNQLASTKIIADHHCVDGWSYLGHEWTGLHLRDLLKLTKPTDKAHYILIECDKGLTQTFPIEQDLLFATKRNGVPLPREGGYPLRAVAPGEYGYKSVKWVRKIRFTEKRELDSTDLSSIRWGIDIVPPEENPWNCDNNTRKKLLRKVFTMQLREERQRRIEEVRRHSNE